MRQPLAQTGREGATGKLGSQETSLRSLHQSPRGKGSKDASSLDSTCLSALCAAVLSLAVLPATATATSTQGEIDAAIAKAVEYVRGQQDPVTGEPFEFESRRLRQRLAGDLAGRRGRRAPPTSTAPPPAAPACRTSCSATTARSFGPAARRKRSPRSTTTSARRSSPTRPGLDPARLAADANLPAQIAERWNPANPGFGEASTDNTVFGILALKAAARAGLGPRARRLLPAPEPAR